MDLRKFLRSKLKRCRSALWRQKPNGNGFEGWEAKVPKPMQAYIAVFGAGVGVFSFAAAEDSLPPKALIAAAAAAQSLRLLDWPGANENSLDLSFSERPLKVAGTTQRYP